jgi:hypothetical protein
MPISDIEYYNVQYLTYEPEINKIVRDAKQPQSWFSTIYNSITFIYGLTIAKWINPSYHKICWMVYNKREEILH